MALNNTSIMYQVYDVIEDVVVFESFDYEEALRFLDTCDILIVDIKAVKA